MRIAKLTYIFPFLMMASCGKSAGTQKLTWDLSTSNRTQQVNWPNDVNGDSWTIDGPGVIRLKVRGEVEHDIPFFLMQLDRKGDRLRFLRIMTPCGTLDQTYHDAIKLADDWNFEDRRSIENFRKTNGYRVLNAGGEGCIDSNAEQPRRLEIQQSFVADRPWYVAINFGFPQDYDLDKSN